MSSTPPGLDRFPLLGVSQGGAVADRLRRAPPRAGEPAGAVRAYARGRLVRADTDAEQRRGGARHRAGAGRLGPRRPVVPPGVHLPVPPDGTREEWDEFNELQRRTTSPENAVRFLETFARIDVADDARQVACPTLILHARDDHRVPASSARELAALIPDSRLVLLPGRNHILTRAEPAWPLFLAELDAFLAG